MADIGAARRRRWQTSEQRKKIDTHIENSFFYGSYPNLNKTDNMQNASIKMRIERFGFYISTRSPCYFVASSY
jgi:hypothetical protein